MGIDKEKELGVTSVSLGLQSNTGQNEQLKIASFLAMTAVFMAQGRYKGRQPKDGCHCER